MNIVVKKQGIITSNDSAYTSFPYLSHAHDGEFVVTYRQASSFSRDAALGNLATHHDPDSQICLRLLTFNKPECKLIIHEEIVAFRGEYGVNDPAITKLKNGGYLLRFVALNIFDSAQYRPNRNSRIFSHRVEHGLVTEVAGQMVLYSDNLRKWTFRGFVGESYYPPSCSRDPVVELQDKSLIMPAYIGAPGRSDMAILHRSYDGGKSWGCESIIAVDEKGQHSQLHGVNFNETSIVDVGNGHLIAAIRGDRTFYTSDNIFMPVGGIGTIFLAYSHDGGLCWSKVVDTGIIGQPANLIKLKDGNIMLTYGHRKIPFGVMVTVSCDNGRSWSKPELISQEFNLWDCGYPSTIEIDTDTFLSVYYGPDENGIRGIYYSIFGVFA